MKRKEALQLFEEVKVKGEVEIERELFLATAAHMITEQKNWDDGDAEKTKDFEESAFWLWHNGGTLPVSGPDDLIFELNFGIV